MIFEIVEGGLALIGMATLCFAFFNGFFPEARQRWHQAEKAYAKQPIYKISPPKFSKVPFDKLNLESKTRAILWGILPSLHTENFEITQGPDQWSVSIFDSETDKVFAHYWPKSEFFNLIGSSAKGHGFQLMLKSIKELRNA